MSGEEIGFATDGRILLPCDAVAMEYVMCLVRREASEEVERAFLCSIAGHCVAPSMGHHHQFALCT